MRKVRIAFIVEQILGHRTHYKNLQQYVSADVEIEPIWIPIEPWARDFWQKLPIVKNNWTMLSSLRARTALKHAMTAGPIDVIYFHTQVMMLAASSMMKRIPTVASLDATPIGMDSLDSGYGEHKRIDRLERWKDSANRHSFGLCRRIVAWSDWVASSLTGDYGIDPARIAVLPPGLDLNAWRIDRAGMSPSNRVRLLFVGGDFVRKGGDVLLETFRNHLSDRCELDIVTGPDLTGAESMPNVHIHRGLMPNTDELRAVYRNADIFVLPTRGDCMPFVILEAAAAGLPVVTTRLGAIPEMVQDGVTGFLVPPADSTVLLQRLNQLIEQPELRREMGTAAMAAMAGRYDGGRNYRDLLEQLKRCA